MSTRPSSIQSIHRYCERCIARALLLRPAVARRRRRRHKPDIGNCVWVNGVPRRAGRPAPPRPHGEPPVTSPGRCAQCVWGLGPHRHTLPLPALPLSLRRLPVRRGSPTTRDSLTPPAHRSVPSMKRNEISRNGKRRGTGGVVEAAASRLALVGEARQESLEGQRARRASEPGNRPWECCVCIPALGHRAGSFL